MFDRLSQRVRSTLADACQAEWDRIGRAGTWLTATERIAVARETRDARTCAFCQDRKAALSPMMVDGTHRQWSPSALEPDLVDAVHRIATDPGRLSRSWYDRVSAVVPAPRYVEMVGVVFTTTLVDTLSIALGCAPPRLPRAHAGVPSGQTPDGVEQRAAWVPVVPPALWPPELRDLFAASAAPPSVMNILLALTLVPAEAAGLVRLMRQTYHFADRRITTAQTELIAATVSAANNCFY